MTTEAQAPRSFNFTGVEEATDKGFTTPGTKAVFTITKVEFDTSANGKDYCEPTFDEGHSSFRHRFYMTEGAISRMQSLYKAAMGGQALSGDDIPESQISAALMNKRVALKVIGRVGNDGKGYADLSFGGFAKGPDNLADLEFTPQELEKINEAKAASANYNGASPDNEAAPAGGGGSPSPTGGADDF